MPELPEVETIRRGLSPVWEGRVIRDVLVRRATLRFPLPRHFREHVAGMRVSRLDRRGKYLLVRFGNGRVMLCHFGMSGSLRLVRGQAEELRTHDHVVFRLEGGDRIIYHDPRRFGFLALAGGDVPGICPALAAMGPEPLGAGFDGQSLGERLAGRRTAIRNALLDQTTVAGLGNIYVCESLFLAGIAPRRSPGTLSAAETARLAAAIRQVLEAALASGGSTLRDYRQANGDTGYFQHRFQVYGRGGEACPRCGRSLRREAMGGRSVFWCAACQT